MEKGNKIAISACSNGMAKENRGKIEALQECLGDIGLVPVVSRFLYGNEAGVSGTGQQKAEALMQFYKDPEIKAIFDVSGGDMANELLPWLDFQVIGESDKMFWGYSDLTTIINAIYAKTGKKSVLYQIRNLIKEESKIQTENFRSTVLDGTDRLFAFNYSFLQGERMQGIVVGGNIRCLLKLAGTEYWPDMENKILLLEAWHGTVPQMMAYLSQLKQMRVFEKINGIILGTFTQMEELGCEPSMEALVRQYVGPELPIVKTREIGHGADSRAIVIGDRKIL